MGQKSGNVEGNDHVKKKIRLLWGLRPWNRHSLILTVVGVLYALVGFQYIVAESTDSRRRALYVVLQVAPVEFWGGVFMVTGLLAIVSSRWPPFAETWGYMLLTGMSTCWALTYLTGMLFFGSSLSNATQVFLWGCLAFMWWAISGLLNPDNTAVTQNGKR